MTLVQRALFTWFVVLVFCIFLCLRLEVHTQWNYFIVFIPLWVFDAILLIHVIIKIITKWRNLTRLKEILIFYQWYIAAVLLKILTQVMICLKIEYPQFQISIYLTTAPVLILFPSMLIYVFANFIKNKPFSN